MEGSSVERAFSLWLNDGVCSLCLQIVQAFGL